MPPTDSPAAPIAADPIAVLLAHDAWATRQVILACANLAPEQFAKAFPIGPGSLQATLAHVLGAMRFWTDVLAHRDPRPRFESTGAHTPEQLLPFLDESTADFANQARALPLSDTVSRVRDGRTHTFTRCVVVTHVASHGTHHRAQCLNMLRQLGVSPLPKSAITEWSIASA